MATSPTSTPILSLSDIQKQATIPDSWSDLSSCTSEKLQFVKISEQTSSSNPLAMTHIVVVDQDHTWKLYVHGHQVNSQCLSHIPTHLQVANLEQLLSSIDQLKVCAGHPDTHFLKMAEAKKGSLKSVAGSVTAYIDSNAFVELNGQKYSRTLRSASCQLLSSSSKCPDCVAYRDNIRAMYHRWINTCRNTPSTSSSSSHTNDRWMTTPERAEKAMELKKRMRSAESAVKYMKEKISHSTDKIGVSVDDSLHTGLHGLMSEYSDSVKKKYTENSFHRLFWDQQMTMLTKDPKQRRWHPMLIRWCLHLKMTSSATYNSLRQVLTLPCGRTLQVRIVRLIKALLHLSIMHRTTLTGSRLIEGSSLM